MHIRSETLMYFILNQCFSMTRTFFRIRYSSQFAAIKMNVGFDVNELFYGSKQEI